MLTLSAALRVAAGACLAEPCLLAHREGLVSCLYTNCSFAGIAANQLRDQAIADLEDILSAFDALDSSNNLPDVF